jgi:hypothetical protein
MPPSGGISSARQLNIDLVAHMINVKPENQRVPKPEDIASGYIAQRHLTQLGFKVRAA